MACVMFSVCGQLSRFGQEVRAHSVSNSVLVARLDYLNWVPSSAVYVYPHLGYVRNSIGQNFSSGRQAECFILCPEFPNVWAWGPGV